MRRTRAGLNAGKPNSRRDDLVQKVGVLKLFMRVFVQFSNVKRLTILVLLASSAPIARAEQIQITSPDHAYTFAYGAVLSHQVEHEPITNQLIANVTLQQLPIRGRSPASL